MSARIPDEPDESDPSNGWEAVAAAFIEHAAQSSIGVATIRSWAQSLPRGATVLDFGCGPGGPRSGALFDAGLRVYGVDASPTLAAAYQRRFPDALVACEPAETSRLFDRSFDGVIAWGLLFLLPEARQKLVIARVGRAMLPGGRFLFTAPSQLCTWEDMSTGRASWSLGADAYKAELASAGLTVVAEYRDEGENHYFDAVKQG
jgi:cyclopropane fatty-acyl-phospholipid synthase-like methyltransferase